MQEVDWHGSREAGVQLHPIAPSYLLYQPPLIIHPKKLIGDFTYDINGNNVEITIGYKELKLVSTATDNGKQFVAMANWTASGGGPATYAQWGASTSDTNGMGVEDYVVIPLNGSISSVYFGNLDGWYTGGPVTFDANGYTSQFSATLVNQSPQSYGTFSTPVKLSQTVNGLTVGRGYRLQFFQTGEGSDGNNYFYENGVAAVEITVSKLTGRGRSRGGTDLGGSTSSRPHPHIYRIIHSHIHRATTERTFWSLDLRPRGGPSTSSLRRPPLRSASSTGATSA